MFSRRRRREHRPYGFESHNPRYTLSASRILLILGSGLILFGGWRMTHLFTNNALRGAAITLHAEDRGIVRIALQDGDAQQIQGEIKLFSGDRVITNAVGRAMLLLFDGTRIHVQENTNLQIEESEYGSENSEYAFTLASGTLWIRVPPESTREGYAAAFSGSVTRTIQTASFTLDLPPRTEAVITHDSFAVLQAAGIGITTLLHKGASGPIFIGEGQQFAMTEDIIPADWYDVRTPLKQDSPLLAAVWESRLSVEEFEKIRQQKDLSLPSLSDDLITLAYPIEGQQVHGNTIEVRGTAGPAVSVIRVNGYKAIIDEKDRSFLQEVSLPNEEEFKLIVTALDERGLIMTELSRSVQRDLQPPPSPTIVTPSGSGTIYRTNSRELEIRGKAAKGTMGIRVNDYRLQLFQPGDTVWSYLASALLGNLQSGTNVYSIVAIDDAGNQSAPVRITIVMGEGEEGVIEAQRTDNQSEGDKEPELRNLPDNRPLDPGSLRVQAPTAGDIHYATGSQLLIEGFTSPETYSVWINEYKLRLYEPEKDFWNYIASHELGTMNRGNNVYTIITRNRKGEILDKTQYTVIWRP